MMNRKHAIALGLAGALALGAAGPSLAASVPANTAAVKAAFKYYVDLIYPGQTQLGETNPERLSKLQDFYLQKGIIQKKSPVEETSRLSAPTEGQSTGKAARVRP